MFEMLKSKTYYPTGSLRQLWNADRADAGESGPDPGDAAGEPAETEGWVEEGEFYDMRVGEDTFENTFRKIQGEP